MELPERHEKGKIINVTCEWCIDEPVNQDASHKICDEMLNSSNSVTRQYESMLMVNVVVPTPKMATPPKKTLKPETSRVSTPSPTTYLNSLRPLDYQSYHMPSSSEKTDETLFARQITLLNQTQRMHEEMHGGFKSFGKALKGVFSKKKK
nr:hypothetical protein [Tanacetum cinerariifolium]